MLNVLFVDDQKDSVEPAMTLLKEKAGDLQCDQRTFKNCEETLQNTPPDLVVLDLFEGALGAEDAEGLKRFDWIWAKRFCPLIIYSAKPEAYTNARPQHPFVKVVKKGKDSQNQVLEAIGVLKPHAQAIREAEFHIRQQFSVAMREVAPYAWEQYKESKERDEVILRSGRRRLAAHMDDQVLLGQKLASWEHYLSPPVSNDIKLGDILLDSTDVEKKVSSHRIVLSPSCDMVCSDGRKAKIQEVLTAVCCSVQEGLGLIGKAEYTPEKIRERIQREVLTQGYCESVIPLPELRGRVPSMMVNLRKLELLPFDDIGSGKKYGRIASFDSPFREMVSWAFMHTAGRPGLPNRDLSAWTEDIARSLEKKKEKK